MKYLKRYENFDMGRFSEDEDEEKQFDVEQPEDTEGFDDENDYEDDDEILGSLDNDDDDDDDDDGSEDRIWGDEDEIVEKLTAKQMKLPKALRDAIEKKSGGKKAKDDDKDEDDDKKGKKGKKGGKDCDEKEDKTDDTGLTAKQKKLPEGLKKAILAKKKKNKKKK